MGWTENQTFATVCLHVNKGDSRGTMTPTDNREESPRKKKTKDLQCVMAHALASTTLTDFPSVSKKTLLEFSLCTLCQPFNCCPWTNLISFWPAREFLVDIDTAKMFLGSVVFTPSRRLQQTAVSCKRSNCNKIGEKSWKSHVWSFVQNGKQRVSPFYHVALQVSSCVEFHLNSYELHQKSLQCNQLVEELDD